MKTSCVFHTDGEQPVPWLDLLMELHVTLNSSNRLFTFSLQSTLIVGRFDFQGNQGSAPLSLQHFHPDRTADEQKTSESLSALRPR